jgi:hypothetical protein
MVAIKALQLSIDRRCYSGFAVPDKLAALQPLPIKVKETAVIDTEAFQPARVKG